MDYYRGNAIEEQRLYDVVVSEKLFSISEPIQAFKKILAGRTDVYVVLAVRILPLLSSREFQNSGIRVLCTLETIATYPYVHKRHAKLALQLAVVLRQMKAEGLFDAYMEQAKRRFASG